ncbi:alanine dehydrogenase [Chengkuizengella axinellae]|uniref:Alanine dehydrogenase n=1 Tax=Chengkuizengella axinellae TaxID=3064388 RepID=A0ABT9IZL5_9BACL|nr:alanine dehydrogenase [Chengkuizengella sp. 2205SS18-9]MDP5274801.1 alanine dehydrogenase [Chengkuizengella sp. 2205SS18-9]
MIIGVPKEVKVNENRVSLTPAGAGMIIAAGHQVLLEEGAGENSGFLDEDYIQEGVQILTTASDVWSKAEMILKVKEPIPSEYELIQENQLLFTYLHLAAAGNLTDHLLQKNVTSIAYETIQLPNGELPLLTPMSEVAGRMSVQVGAQFLENYYGGRGVLLGGVPGVPPADVCIIGGGVVGTNAAKIALGMGASVVIVEKSAQRMRELDDLFNGRLRTIMSNSHNILSAVKKADLLIGAVLVPGARAPRLVTEDMVKEMKKGSVIVDVAVDQGGSIETIDHSTTHSHPTYEKYGVVHYAVANMPGAVPRTSTIALTNVTMPYVMELVNQGFDHVIVGNPSLKLGVNTYKGNLTYKAVADALGKSYISVDELIHYEPVNS